MSQKKISYKFAVVLFGPMVRQWNHLSHLDLIAYSGKQAITQKMYAPEKIKALYIYHVVFSFDSIP